MHHRGFAQEILPIPKRLAAHVGQDYCRQADEVKGPCLAGTTKDDLPEKDHP